MNIPDERLASILQEYMEEYRFGHKMAVYDPLLIAESFVCTLFDIDAPRLSALSMEILNNPAITSDKRGLELLIQILRVNNGE